ncbi:hypothetical protein F53441_1264 [Fusarium austroafricanum]|uniref:Clr5 domain-containing protein n=1 Tax=Fusarium austroafricanum TaxID=2364996 RepID=A0A8H4P497_9HYPO|nr:hypothetical protein F53441_1264 [Fusarium austroafricanum]
MEVLERKYNFIATEDAFKKRIQKDWPECKKYGRGNARQVKRKRVNEEDVMEPVHLSNVEIDVTDSDHLSNMEADVIDPIPRALSPSLYRSHTLLLQSIGKYTKGFFDNSVTENNRRPAQNIWHRILILCEEISIFPRKRKDLIHQPSVDQEQEGKRWKKMNKAVKGKVREEMKNKVISLIQNMVFNILPGVEKDFTPNELPILWKICRILQGLSSQLGHSEHAESRLMRQFVERLYESFGQVSEGPNTEMRQALQHLLDIDPTELRDASRISCHCSARALASKLEPCNPVILEAWADYYQHWEKSKLQQDGFLNHYDWAYSATKGSDMREGEKYSDRTLAVLINYSYVAHYIYHDRDLAWQLATELWEQTGAVFAEMDPPESWSVQVQGMAQAAQIQALLCLITHEDQLKSRAQLNKKKTKFHLGGKAGRRKYRKHVLQDRRNNHEPEQKR